MDYALSVLESRRLCLIRGERARKKTAAERDARVKASAARRKTEKDKRELKRQSREEESV